MISRTELRSILQKASVNENYLLKNNDARLGQRPAEFSFSDLVDVLAAHGETFADDADFIDYCVDMEFDIESSTTKPMKMIATVKAQKCWIGKCPICQRDWRAIYEQRPEGPGFSLLDFCEHLDHLDHDKNTDEHYWVLC